MSTTVSFIKTLLLFLFLGFVQGESPNAAGINFHVQLKPQERKCFYDTVLQNTLIILSAESSTMEGLIELAVYSRDIVVFEDAQNGSVSTAFTAALSGEYTICTANKGRIPFSVYLGLKKGSEAKDYSEIAKKEHLDPGVELLRKIEDSLHMYHRSLLFLRRQEGRMSVVYNTTASRIVWFFFVNIIVMFGATLIHILHLRNFFRRKKII